MITFLLVAGVLIAGVLFAVVRLWTTQPATPSPDADPEWQVLLAKRNEIEVDVMLDPQTRQALRDEWAVSADQILSRHSQTTKPTSPSLQHVRQHSRNSSYVVAGSIAIAAIALYLSVGQFQSDGLAWSWQEAPARLTDNSEPPPRDGARHPGDTATLDERIASLEKRLLQNPGDLGGWVLLARSRGIQRDFSGSSVALEKALELAPGHPDLLADLADTLAMTADKSLAGRPSALIEQVLQADPTHKKGLSLAATAAMQRNDPRAAATYLQRLRATLAADSPEIAQIDAVLAGFGTTAQRPIAPAATVTTPPVNADAAGAIAGHIVLSPTLRSQLTQQNLPATAVLFVIARSPGGPPMPVAVSRLPVQQLVGDDPLSFRLDDSSAMSPATKLSSLAAVDLEARISLSGTAGKKTGDLIGTLDDVAVGTSGLTLTIQSVLP